MPKIFAITQMQGGSPNTAPLVVGRDFKGFVHCGTLGNFGAYLYAGTPAQLTALDALPTVIGLAVMTEAGNVRWAELDNTITPAHRTRLNTFLTARGLPTIPAGRTYRQVVLTVWDRFFSGFDINQNDLAE